MNRMLRAFVAACAMVFFAVSLDAENTTDATYSIVIRTEAAIDGLEVAGRQIAGTYGGSLLAVNTEERSILVRLSSSRARMAAKDPRLVSVTVSAEPARPKTIATDAEVVPWRTGVSYEYDGTGNVKKIGSDTFVYDVSSRLVQSTVNAETRKFEYDAFGNRTKCTQGMSTDCQGHTINAANNRITGTNVYDAAGNVIQLDGHQYTYDALNRMTSDTDLNNGVIREYIYTADDERIAVYTVNQWWRWTIRDTSGKVLREYMSEDADGSDGPNGPDGKGTANWQWSKDSIWRGSQLLATRHVAPGSTTPVTYHYHLDHLGTPRRITDGNDRIVGFHDYHAFGPEVGTGKIEPSLSLFKYTGHERDIAPSTVTPPLDYMHARFYSGALGRFLSVDPVLDVKRAIREPQAWNRYSYVVNSPINRLDPDGRVDQNWDGGTAAQLFPDDREAQLDFDQGVAEKTAIGAAATVAAIYGGPAAWRALSSFAVRQLAAFGAGGSALLGESMTRRVQPVANALNARMFETTSRNFSQMMSQNMQWLRQQMSSGAKIYDIGIDALRKGGGSPFYKAEVAALQKAGYSRQFVKLIQVDGKTYRLYQWVRPAGACVEGSPACR